MVMAMVTHMVLAVAGASEGMCMVLTASMTMVMAME